MKAHVELLAWIDIVSGLFWELLGLAIAGGFVLLAPTTNDAAGFFALVAVGVGVGGFLLLLGIPTLVAGIGLLKGKSWARILGLIVGILAFFNFPLGTLVAIYTFWVLTNAEVVTSLEARA